MWVGSMQNNNYCNKNIFIFTGLQTILFTEISFMLPEEMESVI